MIEVEPVENQEELKVTNLKDYVTKRCTNIMHTLSEEDLSSGARLEIFNNLFELCLIAELHDIKN